MGALPCYCVASVADLRGGVLPTAQLEDVSLLSNSSATRSPAASSGLCLERPPLAVALCERVSFVCTHVWLVLGCLSRIPALAGT